MSATFYVLQTTKLNLKEARNSGSVELIDLVKNQILGLPKAYAIDFLSLELDGATWPINYEAPFKEELQNFILEIDSSDELVLETSFVTERNYEQANDKKTNFRYGPAPADSPLHLSAYLEEASDDILASIEHSFIIEDEQGSLDDNSLVYYYGYYDNKPHRGLVEEVEIKIEELVDFELSPLDMTVYIDDFEATEEGLQVIKNFADNYKDCSQLDAEGGLVHYYLNGPEITTKEELEKFISLVSKLLVDLEPYRNQEEILIISPVFLDLACDLPKKVRIEFDDNGGHKLYLTSL